MPSVPRFPRNRTNPTRRLARGLSGRTSIFAAETCPAPNDKLDVDPGNGTFLNTREFRYAQFFNRVDQKLCKLLRALIIAPVADPNQAGAITVFR